MMWRPSKTACVVAIVVMSTIVTSSLGFASECPPAVAAEAAIDEGRLGEAERIYRAALDEHTCDESWRPVLMLNLAGVMYRRLREGGGDPCNVAESLASALQMNEDLVVSRRETLEACLSEAEAQCQALAPAPIPRRERTFTPLALTLGAGASLAAGSVLLYASEEAEAEAVAWRDILVAEVGDTRTKRAQTLNARIREAQRRAIGLNVSGWVAMVGGATLLAGATWLWAEEASAEVLVVPGGAVVRARF